MNQEQDQGSIERLGRYLLQDHLRFDAGKLEALAVEEMIGKEFEKARREKGLKRKKVISLVKQSGFGEDELVALENGLLSLKDIPEEVGIRLVQILTGVSDPKRVYEKVLRVMEDVRGVES